MSRKSKPKLPSRPTVNGKPSGAGLKLRTTSKSQSHENSQNRVHPSSIKEAAIRILDWIIWGILWLDWFTDLIVWRFPVACLSWCFSWIIKWLLSKTSAQAKVGSMVTEMENLDKSIKRGGWLLELLVARAVVKLKVIVREKEKKLILHCCLFGDDWEFDRDKIVQLWFAADFFTDELFGYCFFDSLLKKKIIVLSRVDTMTQMSMYKVNSEELDAIIAESPTSADFQMRVEEGSMTVNRSADSWRLSVLGGNMDTMFKSLREIRELRTLLFVNGSLLTQVPHDMFSALKLLTALDLSGSLVTELPSSVADAKELRFLDLSRTLIKRLPQAITWLTKLQTLKLKHCVHLFWLPKGMNKLTSLRHLDFDVLGQLISMPRGMGNLTNLQTLSAFIVDDDDDDEGCNIKELKHMNNLCGSLCISGLEHVLSSEDSKQAALRDKVRLKKLELRWNDNFQCKRNEKSICNQVLRSLQPNSCLEELNLVCFPGSSLPSWLIDPRYGNLVNVTLFKCKSCRALPFLGRLPKLKYLEICDMNTIKQIDHSGFEKNLRAFPALEVLSIDGMLKLKTCYGKRVGHFPCLSKFSIKRCPNLKVLLDFPGTRSIQHLEVIHCPSLLSLPEAILSSRLASLVIEGCPGLQKRYGNGGADHRVIDHVLEKWIETPSSEDEESISDFDLKDNIS